MTNKINRGVYVTMITPYNADRSIDFGAVDALVEFYAENGCDGIFASCQSSEIFFLDESERVMLSDRVVKKAGAVASRGGKKLSVVSSGHISDSADAQLHELNAIAATGPDAVVLISNRSDIANTSSENWIAETDKLIAGIDENIMLGMYECPYPCKRLIDEKMLRYMLQSGRFAFAKDTCCNAAVIRERLKLISELNPAFGLFNANAQTLLETMRAGAWGYCGVMANFHPQLYRMLCDAFERGDETAADRIQSLCCINAFTESLCYPITAKYHLSELENIPMTLYSRTRGTDVLSEYDRSCVRQMKLLTDGFIAAEKSES